MSILSTGRSSAVVGLDVEAGSVAATEIVTNGDVRLGRTGIAELPSGVTREGEVSDPEALGAALKELFAANKLPRTVRVGIASQKVMVRTMSIPRIEDKSELEAAVRFQAADQIAMPLENAVLDWQVLDDPAAAATGQMKVVLVAARRDSITGLVDAVNMAGLRPVGIDVSAFAMLRALVPELPAIGPEVPEISYEERMAAAAGEGEVSVPATPARLFCALGDVTNLAVASGSTCLFTRVSTFGMEGIAQRLAERRELTLEHSRQWISHVGLAAEPESIEGDSEIVGATREALDEGARKLADELRLSLDYYGAQDGAVAVEEIVFCGPGTAVAGLPEAIAGTLGYAMRVARPSALSEYSDEDAARLTLAYGLGLDE